MSIEEEDEDVEVVFEFDADLLWALLAPEPEVKTDEA